MLIKRPANERGTTNLGWLQSWHSFSFGQYRDLNHMSFGPLRVINDDIIAPGTGFGTHPHRDMEIITYVLSGGVRHEDSTGGGGVINPGEVQVMTAGSGLTHSEFNASADVPLHLLQIWIEPAQYGLTPTYDQRAFPIAEQPGQWHLVAAPIGSTESDAVLTINQDAWMHAAQLTAGSSVPLPAAADRQYWLQVASGTGTVGDQQLASGDGLAITDPQESAYQATTDSELLWFDLPAEA